MSMLRPPRVPLRAEPQRRIALGPCAVGAGGLGGGEGSRWPVSAAHRGHRYGAVAARVRGRHLRGPALARPRPGRSRCCSSRRALPPTQRRRGGWRRWGCSIRALPPAPRSRRRPSAEPRIRTARRSILGYGRAAPPARSPDARPPASRLRCASTWTRRWRRPHTLGNRRLTFTELGEDGQPQIIAAEPALWGDAVIVRKDTPSSYHLAVVVDDAWQGVTHVTRGPRSLRGHPPAPPAAGAARPARAHLSPSPPDHRRATAASSPRAPATPACAACAKPASRRQRCAASWGWPSVLPFQSKRRPRPELVEGRMKPAMPCFDGLSTRLVAADRNWIRVGRASE